MRCAALRIRERGQNQGRRTEEASERTREQQVQMATDRVQGKRAESQQAAESAENVKNAEEEGQPSAGPSSATEQ